MEKRLETCGYFVESGKQAPVMFEETEQALYFVTLFVDLFIV